MSTEENPDKKGDWKKALKIAAGILVLLVAVGYVAGLRIESDDGEALGEPNFPPGGPAEFLYLDAERVNAYLAQVNGGSFDAETVTRKLAGNLSAKVAIPGAGEGGGTQSKETSVQREVRPTDASSFFALRNGVDEQGWLNEIGLRYFGEYFGKPDESLEQNDLLDQGDFVTFETTALLSPRYLNAYLAVRNDRTIAAIFPDSEKRRQEAKDFSTAVGPNPRVVFALQPKEWVGSHVETKPFVYLLPMDASRLTAERSLLKYGGGRFTVVGKLVRTFPEKKHDPSPAYIDSATRETWEQPLRKAPLELLCRTDPFCIDEVRKKDLTGEARQRAAERAQHNALTALETQTQIEKQGAVILPIAIYK